tara:strand:- start:16413 stop:17588 length:1176 start_codon:yes stop_codon:yes gene_type:complete
LKLKRKKKILLIRDAAQCLVLSSFITYLLSFAVINTEFFNPFVKIVQDFSYLDVYHSERMSENQFNPEVIIVNIEHRDRKEIAQLLEKVQSGSPKVIGIDILFTSEKDSTIDAQLSKELKANNVVQGFILREDSIIQNHSKFRNSNQGFVMFNFNPNERVIRNFNGYYEVDGIQYTSFATQISMLAMGETEWNSLEYDEALKGETPLSYQGDMDSFLSFGYEEFLNTEDLSFIKNRIFLLGYLGDPTGNPYDIEDKHFTPLNKVVAGKSAPDMFGVVIHANIISMLLKKDFMFRVSKVWEGIIALVLNYFLIMYFMYIDKKYKISSRTKRKITILVVSLLLIWLALLLFKVGIIFTVMPIIAFTFICASTIKYYKHLIRYLQTKLEFKSFV